MFVTAAASSPSWLIRIVSSWLTSSLASATGLLCSPPCLPWARSSPRPCKHCPHPTPPSPHLTCFKQGEEGERAGAGGHRPGVWLWGRTARVWGQPSWDPAFHLFQRILLESSVGGFVLQLHARLLQCLPNLRAPHVLFHPPATRAVGMLYRLGRQGFGREGKQKIKRLSVQIDSAQSTTRQHLTFKNI